MSTLDVAIEYRRRGLSVIPIRPNDKHPLITWAPFQKEHASEETIKDWFTRWPTANVGMVTGSVSNCIVIDLDSQAARDRLKSLVGNYDLSSVPRSRTGKGWQLFFKHPEVKVLNRAGVLPQIDVRGDGGYVVAPPSTHPNGERYKWEVPLDVQLPKIPLQLFQLIQTPSRAEPSAKFDSSVVWEGISNGQRDRTLFQYASQLRAYNASREVAEELILKAASRCKPAFPEREALKKIEQAWKYPAGYSERAINQDESPLFETMDSIVEEEIDYLWQNRIPRAKLTLFEGDPGVGKSYLALAIAARLSTRGALPFDREPEAPLRSLIISAEDQAGDTIKPRLRMLGADMTMIAVPHRDIDPSTIDANLIDRILGRTDSPAFTIIDPIIAFANGRNTDRASEVRGLLGPLASIAEKHKTAVVLIRHLNKSTQGRALYRGQGSIDFAAVCRAVFIFAQDMENPERRMMAHSKASVAGLQPIVEYFINKDTGVFTWGRQVDGTADEMLEGAALSKGRELEKAQEFIEIVLASGPMACNELKKQAAKVGIANKTLWRAKAEMDVQSKKHPSKDGEWWWRIENIGVWPWLVGE